ncbi:DUF3089 domain-containing protein [Alteraurantiacibacter aquimixticola]|uniref:DUF3089 domain-containing protein n=1 Tax=Alteraurantiacibacter aquimixticola TaxID=2489173 RepID=A0A4T3F0L9_9SPHN|nr:DUF3089 domain-containing protein [Alteraurantiacibacter aquimixticola]TIX50582.1 DUF3089 domain-containing protein [Alteraurantiacibacter aquimixticola]
MRKFLYIIVGGILLVAAVLFTMRLYSEELTQLALVPSTAFVEQEQLADSAYADPAMWFSRPGMGAPNDPARWQPAYREVEGAETPEAQATPDIAAPPKFAVFFVHPTSFFDSQRWNAPLDDGESQEFARLFVRGLGSAFNQASEIWAPRYRQATFGAFLSGSEEAQQASDAAYADVALAFDYFLAAVDADTPIVLAGHSQGALHVLRLLREKVAGTELQGRIAMAYPIGWPISIEHDLPGLPLPACEAADQSACIVSWASFADNGDPALMLTKYRQSNGFDGEMRGDSPILCVNPLTGTAGGSAPMEANLGTLVPNEDLTSGELVRGAVPARCNGQGLLLIGDSPEMGAHVLPQDNYHVYDIPLFWANLQADVVRRVSAWQTNH